MDLSVQLARSKIPLDGSESKIECLNSNENLVALNSGQRLKIIPIWEMKGDAEGELYAEYRNQHAEYDRIFVRAGVAARLAVAAKSLPVHLQLVIHAGHRPLEIQRALIETYAKEFRHNNPKATDAEALEYARMYVTDPDLRLPPHCCGAAVDVQLFDSNASEFVDMGGKMNFGDEISHLHSSEVTTLQHANRMILLEAMLSAGFASFPAEWWHYSYGDQVWAWFYGEEQSLYALVDM